jgi:hypothetical protein
MAENTELEPKKWPTEIGEDEDLYAVVDEKTGEVPFLVFTSMDKKATLIRDSKAWAKVGIEFIDSIDDPDLYNEFVSLDFIDYYDKAAESKSPVMFAGYKSGSPSAVTAAAGDCPPATQDVAVNLKNRENAIKTAGYGPLNPESINSGFWTQKAARWSVSSAEARKSLCGNCVMFVVTTEMKDCIAGGLEQGGSSESNAWDAIDTAELGYCEAFDFKCAASRTCDAWVTGGPITDKIKSDRGIA